MKGIIRTISKSVRKKRILPGMLMLLLASTALSLPASAAVEKPAEMTDARWAQLNDSTIEWDEISDLVKLWNPTYTTYSNQAKESISSMKTAASDDISKIKSSLEETDDSVDLIRETQKQLIGQGKESSEAYQQLDESLQAAKTVRSVLSSSLSRMGATNRTISYSEKNAETSLSVLRDQMISVVEGLVISYKTLEVNRSMLAEQVQLYQQLLATQQNLCAQNLATQADVQKAADSLSSAQQTLASLDSGMVQLKKNLLIQCGYSPDAEVTVAALPDPDRAYLSGRDIAADRQNAVNANSSVQSAGMTSAYDGNVFKYRDANENAAAAKAAAAFDSIRAELEKESLLCDASDTAFQKAALMAASADRKYELGLLGRSEYEGLKMQYIAAKATAELNVLNLHQAIENYKYAVRGIMSVE